MNLGEVLFGARPLSVRRVANLVWGLPGDGAVAKALAEDVEALEPSDSPPSAPVIPATALRSVLGMGG